MLTSPCGAHLAATVSSTISPGVSDGLESPALRVLERTFSSGTTAWPALADVLTWCQEVVSGVTKMTAKSGNSRRVKKFALLRIVFRLNSKSVGRIARGKTTITVTTAHHARHNEVITKVESEVTVLEMCSGMRSWQ